MCSKRIRRAREALLSLNDKLWQVRSDEPTFDSLSVPALLRCSTNCQRSGGAFGNCFVVYFPSYEFTNLFPPVIHCTQGYSFQFRHHVLSLSYTHPFSAGSKTEED